MTLERTAPPRCTIAIWWAIGLFSASCIAGLLFLMKGVNHLSEKKSFDIYAMSLRIFSILQILFVIGGVIMLCPIVNHRPPPSSESGATIENLTIVMNGSNFTFSAKKPEAAHAKTP
jgi:hypothetical protein